MIEIDGSQGEGGGQILRSSLALSLITQRPFHLRNVRAGRSKPGLQPQHLMSVKAAAAVGNAHVRGHELHSTDLVFEPGAVNAGSYHFPIGTAGAVSLVLQTVYLPLSLCTNAPNELTLEGGTHVKASPCFHFIDVTWRKYLEQLGIDIALDMRRPGFYPRGGGLVHAKVKPCPNPQPVHLTERSRVPKITGISAVSNLPENIAERQTRQALERLRSIHLELDIRQEQWHGGPGTMLALIIDTTPAPTLFFGLGARGKLAERVADEAVDQVLAYLATAPAAVDLHSADQLVLPCVLAAGPSEFTVAEVTQHLLTNIAVIRRFVDREIVCEGAQGAPGVIRIM